MANDFSPYIPQWWAIETIRVLKNKMVVANLVHREFESMFQKWGDVVNTRKPRMPRTRRKDPGDDIQPDNAIADNIAVPLDQHIYSAFEVEDEFDNKSMKQLIEEFIEPHATAMAQDIDRMVLGQLYHYSQYQAGATAGLTDSNGVTYLTELDRVMTVNQVPEDGRQLIINPYAAEKFLQNATFHQADRLGDSGSALRNASLGTKFGFNIWKCQGAPYVTGAGSNSTTINNGNLTQGSTVITVASATGAEGGDWITVAGNVYQIASVNSAELTLTHGLVKAIAHGAAVTIWPQTTTNLSGTLASGWRKEITLTSTAEAQVGRLVTFGSSTVKYTIVGVNGSDIQLDRPLEAQLTTGAAVHFGPAGGFNFAFVKQALSLVLRPLKPETEFGSKSATISFDGIPMRAEISRDPKSQKKLVTLDLLAGLKPLDAVRGAVLLT